MADPQVDISVGFSIAYGSSGFAEDILDITPPESSVDDVETSHQGTTVAKTYIPTDLIENNELKYKAHMKPGTTAPIGTVQTVTLTFPSGTTWAFSGYMKSRAPDAPFGDKLVDDVTVKVSGEITTTPAA